MEILITNKQDKIPMPTNQILEKGKTILNALGLHKEELSIVFVDDIEITELNEHYRGKNLSTNVLSFSMREGEFPDITNMLGDVVISVETAKREAETAGITFDERISQLLVHGILHLTGLDHEKSEKEAIKMEKKSIEILRLIEQNDSLDFF